MDHVSGCSVVVVTGAERFQVTSATNDNDADGGGGGGGGGGGSEGGVGPSSHTPAADAATAATTAADAAVQLSVRTDSQCFGLKRAHVVWRPDLDQPSEKKGEEAAAADVTASAVAPSVVESVENEAKTSLLIARILQRMPLPLPSSAEDSDNVVATTGMGNDDDRRSSQQGNRKDGDGEGEADEESNGPSGLFPGLSLAEERARLAALPLNPRAFAFQYAHWLSPAVGPQERGLMARERSALGLLGRISDVLHQAR
jgi:hypothetical protein